MIAMATYELFSRYEIRAKILTGEENISEKIIVFAGGGNLVEGKYDHMAKALRHYLPRNHCVVLPHTVFGYREIIAETWKNLRIFCRDPVSYQLCTLNGANPEQLHLAHDMAFYLPIHVFSDFYQSGGGRARCLRTDGESTRIVHIDDANRDISLSWNGGLWHDQRLCRHVTWSLASYLAPFKEVETDRLHIGILAGFLGKDVILYPNNYYKNRAIFEHSIASRFDNVNFVNTSTDLLHSQYVDDLLRQLKLAKS